jgi:Holliday junction resolvase RusA-like endonuclease
MPGTFKLNDDTLYMAVAGKPIPQPRPRFAGRRVISRLDQNAQNWYDEVHATASAAATVYRHEIDAWLADGSGLEINIHFMIADSRLRKPKKDPHRAGQVHLARPDIDNLAKLVLDAMNDKTAGTKKAGTLTVVDELIYADDSLVAAVKWTKAWTDHDGALISVSKLPLMSGLELAKPYLDGFGFDCEMSLFNDIFSTPHPFIVK